VNGQPADGYRIVFSYEANGPWVTQPALSGSGKPGFYTHIISVGVPRVGNWYAWLVDQNRQRISTDAVFTTDGANGACNVVSVNFLFQK
jgi:lysophospholipase L1-like esterase